MPHEVSCLSSPPDSIRCRASAVICVAPLVRDSGSSIRTSSYSLFAVIAKTADDYSGENSTASSRVQAE